MKSRFLWWLRALLVIGQPQVGFGSPVPQVDTLLPPLPIEIPVSAAQRSYLGLQKADPLNPGEGTVDATAIKGRLLLIEIFSMYCPHCQREAPAVNRLYQAIEASPKLRGQVKMIGIGIGNSEFEVDHFRKHYQIEFPLFPDEDFEAHQELGEVRTPFFIIVGLDPENRGKVLWTGAGKMGSQEAFLSRLEKLLK